MMDVLEFALLLFDGEFDEQLAHSPNDPDARSNRIRPDSARWKDLKANGLLLLRDLTNQQKILMVKKRMMSTKQKEETTMTMVMDKTEKRIAEQEEEDCRRD